MISQKPSPNSTQLDQDHCLNDLPIPTLERHVIATEACWHPSSEFGDLTEGEETELSALIEEHEQIAASQALSQLDVQIQTKQANQATQSSQVSTVQQELAVQYGERINYADANGTIEGSVVESDGVEDTDVDIQGDDEADLNVLYDVIYGDELINESTYPTLIPTSQIKDQLHGYFQGAYDIYNNHHWEVLKDAPNPGLRILGVDKDGVTPAKIGFPLSETDLIAIKQASNNLYKEGVNGKIHPESSCTKRVLEIHPTMWETKILHGRKL